jgi:general secretion pathway protein I
MNQRPQPPAAHPPTPHGFTLIEVLVALGIVAVALAAGVRATAALTQNAQRQTDVLLAQLCAENELIKARLSKQMPDVGDGSSHCEQAGHDFTVTVAVRPTPNPSFRRVTAQVSLESLPVLNLSTIVGRY